MKKITSFLTFLILAIGNVNIWAQGTTVSDINNLSNNKAYTLETLQRGFWASTVNGNKMTSTMETPSIPAENQQFALLKMSDENYYIYSVAAKKFVRPTQVLLADKGTAIQFNKQDDGTFVIKVVGQSLYCNLGNGGNFTFDGWGNADGGNKLTITEAGDFDPTEATEIWTADNAFGHKVFTITSKRGNWTANATGTALTSTTTDNMNSSDGNQQWTILRFDGKYYIYNVGTKKYLKKDGTLFAGKGDPININRVANDNGYPYMLNTEDTYYFNMQNNGNGFSINNYNNPDDGNQQAFNVIEGKDVYSEAYELFTAVEVTVNYKIYYNNELAETISGVAATATKPAALPNANINGLYSYSYDPAIIAETTTDVTVTATWNGDFKFSTSYANANWYNMYIRNAGFYVSYSPTTEPYTITKDATEAQKATDAFQWAFVDGGYGKVQVLNKAAGEGKTLKADNGNPVMRDGATSWDIFKSGEGFVLRETGTDNNYINQTGGVNGPFGFWKDNGARNDGGSRLYLTDVPEIPIVTVTYNVKYGNEVVATATAPVQQGGIVPAIPASLNRDYVTLTPNYDNELTINAAQTVEVTATWNGPTLNASVDNATWQNLAIRGTWYVTSDNKADDGALKTVNANAIGLVEDAYQWALVGDPYHIQLFNKAETNNFGYDNPEKTGDIPAFTATTSYWTLKQSTSGITGFMLYADGTNLQINQNGGAGGSLKFYDHAATDDQGSTLTLFDVPTNFATYAADLESQFKQEATGYFTLKDDVRALWKDDYKTNCTYEEYKALREALDAPDAILVPETGYYRIYNKTNRWKNGTGYLGVRSDGNLSANIIADGAEDADLLVNPEWAATVIRVIKVDGGYNFAIDGKYIGQPNSDKNIVPLADEAELYTYQIVTPGVVRLQATNGQQLQRGPNKGKDVIGWNENGGPCDFYFEDAITFTVPLNKVGDKYYATLCVPFEAMPAPNGNTTAYTITVESNRAKGTDVEGIIAAGTPVVLEDTEEAATFNIGSGYAAKPVTTTDLTGSYLPTEISTEDYVLGNNEGQIGFYHWECTTLAANRAYLHMPTSSEARGFALSFGDVTTGISTVNGAATVADGTVYDLQGRRVAQSAKGLNIVRRADGTTVKVIEK